jgi:AraC-like DNA-binding protein
VLFVVSGWGQLESPDEVVPIWGGAIATIPAGLPSRVIPQGQVRTVTLLLRPAYLVDQLRWLPAAHPLVHLLQRTHNGDGRLRRLHVGFDTIRAVTSPLEQLATLSPRGGDDFARLAVVATVFHAVGRLQTNSTGTPLNVDSTAAVPRSEVLRATKLLENDLRRRWNVNDLAGEVLLSSSQLTRLFQQHLGVSPASYLANVRGDRMAEILSTTSLGVGEAANLVGWRNTSVGSRAFKRRFGVSPRDFANSLRRHRGPSDTGISQHKRHNEVCPPLDAVSGDCGQRRV